MPRAPIIIIGDEGKS